MRYPCFLLRKIRFQLLLLMGFVPALVVCGDIPVHADDQIEQWGFPVGEELVYRAYWGAVPVGQSIVRTAWKEGAEGELLHLKLEVRSNRAIAMVYPVSIDVETVVRVKDFLPIRHTQRRREGRRRAEVIVDFDYEKGIAVQNEVLRGRKTEIPLEEDTRDIFTFLYYVRRYPMALGNKAHYRVLTDDRIYDLWLNVANEEVMVSSVLDDDVAAFDVEPEAAFEGVFRRHGRLDLHISRDARQMMLFMRANIPVGSVRTVLQEVRGPGNDAWGMLDGDD